MKPLAFKYHEIQPDVLQRVEGGSYLPEIIRYEKPGRGDYHSRCRWMIVTVDGEMITGLMKHPGLQNVYYGDVKGNNKKKSLLVAFYYQNNLGGESFTIHIFEGQCLKPKEQRDFVERWARSYWKEKHCAERTA